MKLFGPILITILLAASTANAGDLKFLVDKAEAGAPFSVEEFLNELPGPYKENYLLGYNPRGLGFGDIENPRIISFNPQGNSFIALQSSPEGDRGQSIEMIDFDPETKSYTFYDIHLGPNPKVLKNPAKCMGCHRGRPLWDNYPLWPGFVGSATWTHFIKPDSKPLELEFEIIRKHVLQESPNSRITIFTPYAIEPGKKSSPEKQIHTKFFHGNSKLNRNIFMLEAQRIANHLEGIPFFYEYYAPITLLLIAGRDEFWNSLGGKPKAQLDSIGENLVENFWPYINDVKERLLENGIFETKTDGTEIPFVGFAAGFELQVSESAIAKYSAEYFILVHMLGVSPKSLDVTFGNQVNFIHSDGGNPTHEHLWAEVTKRLLSKYPQWGEVFNIFYSSKPEETIQRYGIDYPMVGIVEGQNWPRENFSGMVTRFHPVKAPDRIFERAQELLIEPNSCQAQFIK